MAGRGSWVAATTSSSCGGGAAELVPLVWPAEDDACDITVTPIAGGTEKLDGLATAPERQQQETGSKTRPRPSSSYEDKTRGKLVSL